MADLVQLGINAYKSGNMETAREFLTEAVKLTPQSERAWGYLFNVSTTDQERIRCLRQIIKINPGNSKAASLLEQLKTRFPELAEPEPGPDEPDALGVPDFSELRQSFLEKIKELDKNELPPQQTDPSPKVLPKTNWTLWAAILAGILFLGLLLGLFLKTSQSGQNPLAALEPATITPTLKPIPAFVYAPTVTLAATYPLTATITPRPTFTTEPTQNSTPTLALTATNTDTPGPSPTAFATLPPAQTGSIAATPDPLVMSFDEMCALFAQLNADQQAQWLKKNAALKVGPWKGRTISYSNGNSILIHVDGSNNYPQGNFLRFSFPTLPFQMNRDYFFYGTLITFTKSDNGCEANIRADEREPKIQQDLP